jgi:hypothetical protein
MILISHRGNLFGPNKLNENHPVQIEKVLQLGYDCEIDVFYLKESKQLFLGHDKPEIIIDLNWIIKFHSKLWIHCKNWEAIEYFLSIKYDLNYFTHNSDDFTITSKGFIWANPGNNFSRKFIEVLPENKVTLPDKIKVHQDQTGICSDFIELISSKIRVSSEFN